LRILFVNHKMGFFGGVEQNIADVAGGLTLRGHTCVLAYGESTGRGVDDYGHAFTAMIPCIEAGASVGHSFDSIADEFHPDVVYLHKVEHVSPFLKGVGSAKTVRMVHDHDIVCPRRHKYFSLSGKICDKPAGWRCWLDGAFLDRSALGGLVYKSIPDKLAELSENKKLDRLIVGSVFMQRSLEMNGFSADKIALIPPAVNESPLIRTAVPTAPSLLFVGQLIRGKGVDLLLDAVARMTDPVRVVIAGDGNAREQLEAQAGRLNITGLVTFKGWVDHTEIGSLYDGARAVVVPSRWPEPFGMVGPEAMRHGRAVVAFDAGGIRDWLRHEITGLLVPAGDTAALALALQRALYEPGLAETFGQAGFVTAGSFYSYEAQLDQIEEALAAGTDRPRNGRRASCTSV